MDIALLPPSITPKERTVISCSIHDNRDRAAFGTIPYTYEPCKLVNLQLRRLALDLLLGLFRGLLALLRLLLDECLEDIDLDLHLVKLARVDVTLGDDGLEPRRRVSIGSQIMKTKSPLALLRQILLRAIYNFLHHLQIRLRCRAQRVRQRLRLIVHRRAQIRRRREELRRQRVERRQPASEVREAAADRALRPALLVEEFNEVLLGAAAGVRLGLCLGLCAAAEELERGVAGDTVLGGEVAVLGIVGVDVDNKALRES